VGGTLSDDNVKVTLGLASTGTRITINQFT
jgi:hypothetical protein